MKQLIWNATAQRDLRDIIRYYAQFAPDLPLVLIDRVELAAAKLVDFPKLGPTVPDSEIRVWRAKGTPFLLFYRPTREAVRILKVRHAQTDWKPRD